MPYKNDWQAYPLGNYAIVLTLATLITIWLIALTAYLTIRALIGLIRNPEPWTRATVTIFLLQSALTLTWIFQPAFNCDHGHQLDARRRFMERAFVRERVIKKWL